MRHSEAHRWSARLLAGAVVMVAMVAVGAAPAGATPVSATPASLAPTSAAPALVQASVEASIVSTPAANAVIIEAPDQILVHAAAAIDAGASRLAVYDQNHHLVTTTAPQGAAGDPDGLVVGVANLNTGFYTTVWHLSGTTGESLGDGSSTFKVDPKGTSPVVVQSPQPTPASSPARKTAAKWLQFTFIMVFIGALAVRFLVSAPAARRVSGADQAALLETSDRRVVVVAGAALVAFLPAVWAELAYEAFATKIGFWQAVRPGKIWTFLAAGAPGHFWEARLLLIALAVVTVLPVALGSIRRRSPGKSSGPTGRRAASLMLVGLIAGAAELGISTIPTTRPTAHALPRAAFTSLLDLGHLLGASMWVGGLVAMVALLAMRLTADQRAVFWPQAIPRFSMAATVSLGVLVLTGLWTAWIHVGAPKLLVSTTYGERLLVKLILVAVLALFGAFNLFWVLPRVESIRQGSEGRARFSVVVHHFRRTVAVEAGLGIAILAIVPFLSGSARNQAFQAKAANLTQTERAGDHVIRLKPSGVEPGLTDYDVWLAPRGATRVSLGFASSALAVPETDVVASQVGPDHYRVTGLYTAMVGQWQVRVMSSPGGSPGSSANPSTGTSTSTRFDVQVLAKTPKLPKAPAAKVHAATWEWGIFDVIAVLAVLLAARAVSRRLARRRVQDDKETPPPDAPLASGTLLVPVEV